MSWTWIAVGAAYCGLSVGAGAFGAHGLKGRLEAADLELWETATRYLMIVAFLLFAIGAWGV